MCDFICNCLFFFKKCYIAVFWYTAQKFGNQKSNRGKTSDSENAPSAKENVCSAEREPLLSSVKTDDIPLMSGSMTDQQCLWEKVCFVRNKAKGKRTAL